MARTGRPRKPTALKLAQGNPGKRALSDDEPKPSGAKRERIPEAPVWLDVVGKHEWRRMGRVLAAVGLLTDADLKSFAAYCAAWSTFVAAGKAIKADGEVLTTPNNQLMQNPWVAIRNRADQQLKSWAAEFGFTPSARTKLHIGAGSGGTGGGEGPTPMDEMTKWLFHDHPKQNREDPA